MVAIANIKALIHCDGSQGAYVFTDDTGRVWDAHSTTFTDTVAPKFGSANAKQTGVGYYLNTADSDDFNFGTEPFCIEGWVKPNASTVGSAMLNCMNPTNALHALYFDNSTTARVLANGGNILTGLVFTTGVWSHYALTSDGTTIRAFINGALADSALTNGASFGTAASHSFGGNPNYSAHSFIGEFDEIRIVKGEPVYTEAFTPPTEPFSLTEPFEIANLTNRQVYQRIGTSASVAISGTYPSADTPGTIEARIMDGVTEVVTWTTLDAAPSSGVFSGSISVPQGGQYNAEVRYSNDTNTTYEDLNTWAVGDLIIVAGQSNVERWFIAGTSPTADADISVYDTAWRDPDAVDEGAVAFGNSYILTVGVPVGVINAAIGGSALREENDWGTGWWLATGDVAGAGTLYTDVFEAQLAAVGGSIAGIIWAQGETDAFIGLATEAEYQGSLETLFALFRTDTGNANLPIVCSYLGRSTHASGNDVTFQDVRNAQKTVIAADANVHHVSTLDLALIDTTHYSDIAEHAERCSQSLMALMGEVSYYAGPTLSSIKLVSETEVDVSFTHDSGTDLNPITAISGFQIYNDDILVTIDNVVKQSSSSVRITTLTALSGTVTVDYQYGKNPDVSNFIYDNTALNLPALWFINEEGIGLTGSVLNIIRQRRMVG